LLQRRVCDKVVMIKFKMDNNTMFLELTKLTIVSLFDLAGWVDYVYVVACGEYLLLRLEEMFI